MYVKYIYCLDHLREFSTVQTKFLTLLNCAKRPKLTKKFGNTYSIIIPNTVALQCWGIFYYLLCHFYVHFKQVCRVLSWLALWTCYVRLFPWILLLCLWTCVHTTTTCCEHALLNLQLVYWFLFLRLCTCCASSWEPFTVDCTVQRTTGPEGIPPPPWLQQVGCILLGNFLICIKNTYKN